MLVFMPKSAIAVMPFLAPAGPRLGVFIPAKLGVHPAHAGPFGRPAPALAALAAAATAIGASGAVS
jgi:hypothetical protein